MHLLPTLLEQALDHRRKAFDLTDSPIALRLFNGFWEGWPALAVDLYGSTLLIHGYAQSADENHKTALLALQFFSTELPYPLSSVILKNRGAADPEERRGIFLLGSQADTQIKEFETWYTLDLRRHQDATLYLDTRNLRRWAVANLSGAQVLNTFAYTGSLGAAALTGGAARVIQTDLNMDFISLAKQTYRLNGWTVRSADFLCGDYFSIAARLKRDGALFDCIFLDPPFFSSTQKSRFDLNHEMIRLINKVRPLVGDGGRLVAINNAIFVSGESYLASLQELTRSGYVEIESFIPAPADFTGFNLVPLDSLPTDPSPFNYSTKIAVLRFKRKDGRKA